MKKNRSLALVACLSVMCLVTSQARASDWIQQNRWIVAGPYHTNSMCGVGNAFVSQSLITDCGMDTLNPVAGDPSPNAANFATGGWPLFDTWQSVSARGKGPGDVVDFNTIFNQEVDNVYAVAVIYAKNKTPDPINIHMCMSSDDGLGVVINDTLVWNNGGACRGVGGCDDQADSVLQPGINKIACAAYNGGGGWNFRIELQRKDDNNSIIDDTEAPDVAFDISPTGAFDQFAIKRSVSGASVCGAGQISVSLKGNGLYLGSPGDTLNITERITGSVAVSGISNGGTFLADAAASSSCDSPSTPVGDLNSLDIGGPAYAGSTTTDGTSYVLSGGGNDIWAGGDQFQYAYKQLSGDFTFTAHIATREYFDGAGTSIANPPSRWGKFGVMARQDCTDRSRYTFAMDASPDSNGTDPDSTRMADRPTHGGSDNYETGYGNAGHHADWLKVTRIGNQFYSYASQDNVEWVLLGQQHWNGAPSSCLVGLAVTSHAGGAYDRVTFDNVSITGGTVPTPANVATTGTISWSLQASVLDTGLSYVATPPTANTDAFNYFSSFSGGDDKGHPTAGNGRIYFGHERGAVGPDFTNATDVGNEVWPQYVNGSHSYDAGSGVYTMRGSGGNVWADNDSFHWAYSYVTGDFDVIAEAVEATQPTGSPWGRYGLMARADCGNNARYTCIVSHAGANHCAADGGTCGFRFQSHVYYGNQYVGFDNQTDVRYPGGEPAKWTRMIKFNNVIYGYAADDDAGTIWRPIGSMPFYGADPNVPLQVGFYCGREQGQIEAPVVKFKIHKFGPLELNMPPLSDDGLVARSELLTDSFDSLDTIAWQANHRDAAFNPNVQNGRLRMTDENGGESTSCFSAFGIEDIDASIYEFEFDAYMARSNADHPADGMCFVVAGGDINEASLGRVGFGGGAEAYLGLNRAFGALGGDTNIGNNSFAVEIDTWSGGGWGETEGAWMDTKKWHLGINAANNVNSVVMTHDLGQDVDGNTIPLPDVFDPNGIHMKVRYNRGQIGVWVAQNTADGTQPLTKALEATVVPISFGFPSPSATYGWTGATGGAVEVAEVDNFGAFAIDCNDIPEVAVISDAPAAPVIVGTPVTLGSTGSNAGPGDSGDLTYKWTVVSGPASIVGSDTGATVALATGPGTGDVKVKLTVSDNDTCAADTTGSAQVTITVKTAAPPVNWKRGDANGDKLIDISDAVASLNVQFVGVPLPNPNCFKALDFNNDSKVDISDPVALLGVLFLGTTYPGPAGTFDKCEQFADCVVNCP